MAYINKVLDLPFLTKPFTLFTIVLLLINDHYLKQRYANVLTGKISDFCGLYFFPLFILALITIFCRLLQKKSTKLYQPNIRLLLVIALLTYILFAGLQTSESFAGLYESVMYILGFPSKVTRDTSDLIAFLSIIPLFSFNKKIGQPRA